MTTHISIANKNTFNQHLRYSFVGTGNKEPFKINGNKSTIKINDNKEKIQFGMLVDFNILNIYDKK